MAYSKAKLKSSGDKASAHKEKESYHFLLLLQVIDGQAVVHKIEQVETNSDDQPVKPVVITESGILLTPAPFYVSDESYE
jgi:hypothetical protein